MICCLACSSDWQCTPRPPLCARAHAHAHTAAAAPSNHPSQQPAPLPPPPPRPATTSCPTFPRSTSTIRPTASTCCGAATATASRTGAARSPAAATSTPRGCSGCLRASRATRRRRTGGARCARLRQRELGFFRSALPFFTPSTPPAFLCARENLKTPKTHTSSRLSLISLDTTRSTAAAAPTTRRKSAPTPPRAPRRCSSRAACRSASCRPDLI